VAESSRGSPPALAFVYAARREQSCNATDRLRIGNLHARTWKRAATGQFLKFVASTPARTNGGFTTTVPLSKWNLARNQGLADSFQRWAWQQLEVQDRFEPQGPIDWQPVWRIETLNGVNTLRYMRADPPRAPPASSATTGSSNVRKP